ncbi:HupE/UreJ family protein [Gemmatimonas groenlandica]|uniref:HupE/UreJ family protein n=1 Tax=Gemmatimonas groenlandica TaxID=2732249 RepID=A0A6M4IYN6_9BACT|nr:HupE/UreJ family protein [Gemmatimonas groenlandica]QJR38012.1 HupE/UreJ family protein [Gemmatimonas groenlandica]
MFDEFRVYLELGFRHIADLAGYDHILFVVALAIPFSIRDWRRLAVLVTAFTVGHSITLALATLRLVSVSSNVVETLIPATILFTALDAYTAATPQRPENPVTVKRYLIALLFGLIHGLGFSSYLRALLGDEERIGLPLLAFNVGLELGQLLILALVLAVGALLVPAILQRRRWVQLLVGVTGGLALMLLVQRLRAWS